VPAVRAALSKTGRMVIGQTASILLFLGLQLDLAPCNQSDRLRMHQRQLTFANFISEIHDVHCRIAAAVWPQQRLHLPALSRI
jgi:glutathione S-transferase